MADEDSKMQKMLDIAGQEGNKNDIQFNAKKSVIIIFNQPKGVASNFYLNGVLIPIVNETRYLGVQISNTSNCLAQVNNRLQKARNSYNNLRMLGLSTSALDINTRGFLYKTYIRPILHYGLENFDLNQNEMDKINTGGNNIIKSMVGLNKQVRSTSLLAALNIEQTNERLVQEKLQFFIRLYENNFTRNVLLEIAHANNFDGFQVEICKILKLEYTSDSRELIKPANHHIFALECNHKDSVKYDDRSHELKKIFKIKNREIFIIEIYKCIGYTTKKAAPLLNVQNCFSIL